MSDNKEELKWVKKTQLPIVDVIKPLLGNILLLLEEEKKRTEKQLEDAKKLLGQFKKEGSK